MNFDEWFDGKYIKEADLFCKRQLKEAFNDGQRNCGCVHTDNTQVILNLKDKVKELKQQNNNLIEMLKAEREVRVNDDYLKRVCEFETQIEKMKCCENCKYYEYTDICGDVFCKKHCSAYPLSNWELKE